MRRTLVIFAGAVAGFICALGNADTILPVSGEWATEGHAAHVRIAPCASESATLCGTITWLWEAIDSTGNPTRDANNPDPKLRDRSLVGLHLLREFRVDEDAISEGEIYNPENGRTYRASLRLRSSDMLEVKGCFMLLCDTQVWRRLESVCTAAPALRP